MNNQKGHVLRYWYDPHDNEPWSIKPCEIKSTDVLDTLHDLARQQIVHLIESTIVDNRILLLM